MIRYALLLAVACSVPGTGREADDSAVVATVEDRTISTRDLRAAAQDLVASGRSPEEAKAAALEALIQRQLMVVEAIAQGIEQGEIEQRRWRKINGDMLRQALEEDLVADLNVSEEELAAYLEMATRVMVIREIVAPDSATAARALAEIQSGTDFSEVAARYSIDPEAKVTGGLRQPILEASIAMAPNRILLDHRAGDIVGPYRFRQLYYVTRIEDRRPVANDTWTADLLLPRVAQYKRNAALDDYLAKMKQKYHYTFNDRAARRVAAAVREVMAEHDSLRAEMAENAVDGRMPPDKIDLRPRNGGDVWGLSDSLRGEWMYKHDLGGRTVGLYVDRMARVPTDWVSTNTNPSKIEFYCEEFFKDDVYPLEAKERGLDVKIDYEHKRRQRYEEVLTEQLYRREVFEKINPDVQTLKPYWEEHQSEFPVPDAVTATSIVFSGPEAAALALLRLQAGETFEDLAREFETSDSDSVEVERGERSTSGTTWLGANLRGVPTGQIKAAVKPDGRHCILRVDRREPGEPNFTRSYDDVLTHYRYSHDEPVLTALLDKLRERYTVVVNEELVAALTLSD